MGSRVVAGSVRRACCQAWVFSASTAAALGKMSRKLFSMPPRPPWMAVNTLWSWWFTKLVSMMVTRDMEQELRVMGTASFSSRTSTVRPRSGRSAAAAPSRRRVRTWLKAR